MKGYVFIGNSAKPTKEKYQSREIVTLSNVSRPCLKIALDMGYDVYLGVNRENPEGLACELPVKLYDANTYRSLLAFRDNRIAYRNLSKVLKEGQIEVIHCNTPIGGMIGRLCGKRHKVNKIIYTAHGFHFYKGAPLFNRTVLKWAEKLMARWTDAIITMNREDYEAARKFKLKKGGKVYFVHGVGITLSDFVGVRDVRDQKREELCVKDDDIVLVSMGDLIERKNYDTAILAIAAANNPALQYFICGTGPEEEKLKNLAQSLGISDRIHFLGFRSDVKELLAASDIFLFTSKQEGLPRSMMEAMACGLPCVASEIRGNVDLMENAKGGYLCQSGDVNAFARAIVRIAGDEVLRSQMRDYNLARIQDFDVAVVEKELKEIYSCVLTH